VACELGATPAVPAPPIATTAEWLQSGPAWAAGVLGILTQERALRAREHECLGRLRARGVVR